MKQTVVCLTVLLLSFFGTAQTAGSKVSFPGTDGKTYTGVIKQVTGDKYLIKYDGYEFEAWVVRSQFTLLSNGATEAPAPPNTGNWHVGDKVEAYDLYTSKWENATIIIDYTDRTPKQWRVQLDVPGGQAIDNFPVTAKDIRPRGARGNINFSVGSRVDAYYSSGEPKGRATVLEVKGNGRYKVRYDGCAAHWDEEVDWSQLKPESVVSQNDPDITVLFGKWAMFVYSYPNTVIHGDNVYREYGTGAKAPPLQINANGTYVWYDEFNKPPVKGTWGTHAKIDRIDFHGRGTDAYNGIILKDSHGVYWKIHKDRQDHIEARIMCSGETQGGTRIK